MSEPDQRADQAGPLHTTHWHKQEEGLGALQATTSTSCNV